MKDKAIYSIKCGGRPHRLRIHFDLHAPTKTRSIAFAEALDCHPRSNPVLMAALAGELTCCALLVKLLNMLVEQQIGTAIFGREFDRRKQPSSFKMPNVIARLVEETEMSARKVCEWQEKQKIVETTESVYYDMRRPYPWKHRFKH